MIISYEQLIVNDTDPCAHGIFNQYFAKHLFNFVIVASLHLATRSSCLCNRMKNRFSSIFSNGHIHHFSVFSP